MSEQGCTAGRAMYALMEDLYPICRSITGDGFRRTLRRLREEVRLEVREVPSATPVFDWTVPNEWNIRDAFIKNSRGERVVDFQQCNLHVVNYSTPVRRRMSLAELRPHLYSIPEHPDWIPYRTTYYKKDWGFCLSHRRLESLSDDEYDVCIDATLEPGSLTYGELYIPGRSDAEVLISAHSCHPSLANDNLSGMSVAVELARTLGESDNALSYRFLWIPGTIGSITWLALNEETAKKVRHGLVLTCLGDGGQPTYKRSRKGDALIDRAARHVLEHWEADYEILDFVPYGYDERQYCSPGFDLSVGCLMRTPNGRYPEYHTSADDLTFVDAAALEESLALARRILDVLEDDTIYVNLNPKCEPQLGRRGLYEGVGGRSELPGFELALLWVLNQSDGRNSLFEIAERAGMPFHVIRSAANALAAAGLLGSPDSVGGSVPARPHTERRVPA